MSLIRDAMSRGCTKGEDESPPESRRTNGDIKSLLRPGTKATGVLRDPLLAPSSFPSTCPRFLDTFRGSAYVNRERFRAPCGDFNAGLRSRDFFASN